MNKTYRILIADDERTFRESTADLFRRAGYECETAPDGESAAEMLAGGDYQLLIADIKMPGNPNLELIRRLSESGRGIPVILVTGFPSVDTAVDSIQLPVAAYLTKPVQFEELLTHTKVAIERYKTYTSLMKAREELGEFSKDQDKTVALMKTAGEGSEPVPVEAFLAVSFRNIIKGLHDVKKLSEALCNEQKEKPDTKNVCRLFDCPRIDCLRSALVQSVEVLKKTKSSFKSVELARLRQDLVDVLNQSDESVSGKVDGPG